MRVPGMLRRGVFGGTPSVELVRRGWRSPPAGLNVRWLHCGQPSVRLSRRWLQPSVKLNSRGCIAESPGQAVRAAGCSLRSS
jgi:hypothetical protein